MDKLPDSEIIKALENEIHLAEYVDSDYCSNTEVSLLKSTLDLINRLQAEKQEITEKFDCQQTVYADLSKIIKDKCKEIESLQAENEELKKAKYIFSTVDYCADDLDKALEENTKLKAENERLNTLIAETNEHRGAVIHAITHIDQNKAEAYKECIEKAKYIICNNTYPDFDKNGNAVCIWRTEAYKKLDNLLKELVGEDDEQLTKM